jgi:hypothetical protein
MTLDLSYIHEQPSEEQEAAVKQAVEYECIRAIVTYLNEVGDTMETHNIEHLSVLALRAMAAELSLRLPSDDQN